MQLSSTLQALQQELSAIDVDMLSRVDATRVLEEVVLVKNQLDAFVLAVAARAVVANQHNVDGARSGAAWVAAKTGVSERQARAELALGRQLDELPALAKAVRNGSLSLAKASAIGRGAEGDEAVASSLLDVASNGTVEMIELRAREIRSAGSDASQRERLRKSQFVQLKVKDDSMVNVSLNLMPELAVAFLEADRKAEGATSYERAESFVKHLTAQGSKKTEVVFHLDLSSGSCEMKGVGPVPAIDNFEEASFKLVGTKHNKLVWFSETDRRSSKELPEYIKRAVKAKAYDRCEADNCVNVAEEVDHVVARCNGGTNHFENLQALCEQDHHAKTKVDAPWTAGAIYGKQKVPPAEEGDGDAA